MRSRSRLLALCAAALLSLPVLAQSPDADGDGYTVEAGDCDDANPAVNPGATEICNGIDDDCDLDVDEGGVCAPPCPDADADGYAVCTGGCEPGDDLCGDCNDGNPAVNPGVGEACNGADDDCDGAADEGGVCGPPPCPDADADGWAVCGGSCAPVDGDQCGDCNDGASSVNPGRSEACNGRDDNCNGSVDEGVCGDVCPDADGDGFAVCGGGCQPTGGDQCGDCDDGRASVRPGQPEACNGRDDDCDGLSDEGNVCAAACPDADADGWAVCSGGCQPSGGDRCGDCDDARATVNPNRAEVCNGRDDDCDGASDEGNPAGGSCRTGIPGICSAGTLICSGGSQVCDPVRDPRQEICTNGEDDDCDGKSDAADLECAPGCQGGLGTDTDGDGVPDCADTCPGIANPGQADFDGDGVGDACETGAALADIDRSGRVDGSDLVRLARAFGRRCGGSGYGAAADLDRDCTVDGNDLALLAASFGATR